MVSEEDEYTNFEAGADILDLVYNKHELSCKAIIHSSNLYNTLEIVNRRNINSSDWEVICSQEVLISSVK